MSSYQYFLIISLLASIFGRIGRVDRVNLRYIPPFLFVNLVVELVANYMSSKNINNIFLYNIEVVFEFSFYLFLLRTLLGQFIKTYILRLIIYFYIIISLINIFFIQGKYHFETYTFILGCLFIISLSIFYYLLLLRYSKSPSLMHEPAFWIATGIFFYHTTMLPIFGIINFMSNVSVSIAKILGVVVELVNILLYILFTIGFLCKIKIPKLSH
jgi:hypothetical protein